MMSCMPEKTESNLKIIVDIYRRAQHDGISQTELNQAKNKSKSRVVLASERPMGRMSSVGGNWVQWREYISVRDELDAIDAVTLDEANAVLKKYPPAVSTTVTVGPREEVAAPE